MSPQNIQQYFSQRFGSGGTGIVAPGRINLIGDHTDYLGGWVPPAAIDLGIGIWGKPSADGIHRWMAADLQEEVSWNTHHEPDFRGWSVYPFGCYGVLRMSGYNVEPLELAFGGNLPTGAGLSSSAALCCGILSVYNKLFNLNITLKKLARLTQRVEQEYARLNCGLMDQLACLYGLENTALLIDCSTLEMRSVSYNASGFNWLLIHSGVKHNLASSAYNERVEETAQALRFINLYGHTNLSFREINLEIARTALENEHGRLYKRIRHYITENIRVLEFADALANNDLEYCGSLLSASHASLASDYAVTCPETDLLNNLLSSVPGIYGSRQMGGGFGGCLIAVTSENLEPSQLEDVLKKYCTKTNLRPAIIPVSSSRGCQILKSAE